MTYNLEEFYAIQVKLQSRDYALNALRKALRQVLNSPEYEGLSNDCKAEILLNLENGGEYNPFG